jgi:hypothetical protein
VSTVEGFTGVRARPDPDLLMALRAAGCPIQQIAERIGQSRASIYRWLVRYGIPRRAVTLRRGAQRTHGDRGLWLATPDRLALWQARKPDIAYIAQYSGARPAAIRERLITAGALPMPHWGRATRWVTAAAEESAGGGPCRRFVLTPAVGVASLPSTREILEVEDD